MKSKTEKTKLEKDPTNPSRRNAILTTGAGVVTAVGAQVHLLKLTLKKVQLIKILVTWTVQRHL